MRQQTAPSLCLREREAQHQGVENGSRISGRCVLKVHAVAVAALLFSGPAVNAQSFHSKVRLVSLVPSPTLAETDRDFAVSMDTTVGSGGRHDLLVGYPGYDRFSQVDAGGWALYYFSAAGIPTAFLPSSAHGTNWNVGTAVAFIDSSDATARLVSGDPGANVDSVPDSGRLYVGAAPPNIGQNTPLPVETPEQGDRFGSVLAVGDLNDDGYEDLVVGVPLEDVELTRGSSVADRGVVHVYYGAAKDLDLLSGVLIESPFVNIGNALFGAALAIGDFDGDGYGDLAVGEPGAHVSGQFGAGAVHLYFGSTGGVSSNNVTTYDAGDFGLTVSPHHEFGAALAAGDFDRDIFCVIVSGCMSDLAIGVPGFVAPSRTARGEIQDEGLVVVANGSSTGLSTTAVQTWQQDQLGSGSDPVHNADRFGERLWAGDIGPSVDGLVIGVPSNYFNGSSKGVVHLLFGGANGLGSHGADVVSYTSLTGVDGPVGDRFGWSFTSGYFDDDDAVDFAIGAPGMTVEGHPNSGEAILVYTGCIFCDGFESGDSSLWSIP